MKERIEKKIKSSIEAILRKEHIDLADYQMLTTELARLNADERAKKRDEENAERNECMSKLMAMTFTK